MSTICTPLVNRLDEVVTEVDDVYDWYVDESDEIVQFITQSRPTKQTAVQPETPPSLVLSKRSETRYSGIHRRTQE
ncbi:hypothetical protein ACFQMM_22705 [Saliphagus sp. GCM10025308]